VQVKRSTLSQLLASIQSNIMAAEQRDWYDTPLYYDIIFDGGTEQEADFLMSAYHRYVADAVKKPLVLEPACGSGRLMQALQKLGCTVHGFDLGEEMVRYAEKRMGRSAVVWQDRMESFGVPAEGGYDFAHCLVSTFKYLLTEEHARAHLQKVCSVLKPGGIYILGVHLSDYSLKKWEHERWHGSRDGVAVVCNTRTWPADKKQRLENIRTRLRINERGRIRLQETHWQFRTYDAAQLRRLLKSVPEFELLACHDFTHDIEVTRKLDDSYSDIVLVLRRR